MKTIFDKENRKQLINRIEQITEDKKAKWGKMNVFQMLKHNTYWNRWILGKDNHVYKQAFMGKIFGKIALNDGQYVCKLIFQSVLLSFFRKNRG